MATTCIPYDKYIGKWKDLSYTNTSATNVKYEKYESVKLSETEVTSTILTNYGQTSDITWTLPKVETAVMFRVIIENADFNFYIEPPKGESFTVDTTTFTMNSRIRCSQVIGDMLLFHRVRTGASNYKWFVSTFKGTFFDGGVDTSALTSIESPQLPLRNFDTWLYLDDGTDPGTTWTTMDYSDTNWKSGMGPLGYNLSTVNTTTTSGNATNFFRKVFYIYDEIENIPSLELTINTEDGYVIYINENEVHRNNLPEAGSCDYTTLALSDGDASASNTTVIDSNYLLVGANILAIEVHNSSLTSNDSYMSLTMKDTRHTIRKNPYLILSETGKIKVLWQLTATGVCTLEYGEDLENLGEPLVITESGSGTDEHQYEYTWNSLIPYQKYTYRVIANGCVFIGDFLAPPDDSAEGVNFYVVGDTASHREYVHNDIFNLILADIASNPYDQTFFFVVGDVVGDMLIGDGEDQWDDDIFNDDYRSQFDFMTRMPWAIARGNHDVDVAGTSLTMRKYFPHDYVDPVGFYWSFDYGPVHVTVVDHYVDWDVGSDQLAWFEQDLANTTKPWKIVMMHEPPYTDDNHDIGGHSGNDLAKIVLHPICVEQKVNMVLSGHNHSYIRCVKDNIQYVTTAGGGGLLYDLKGSVDGDATMMKEDNSYHYSKLMFDNDQLTLVAIRRDGTIIEAAQVDRNAVMVEPDTVYRVAICSDAYWAEPTFAGYASAEERDTYFDRNYVDLNRWASTSRDISTATGENKLEHVVIVEPFIETNTVQIAGWTTDTTNYILIEVADSAKNKLGTGAYDDTTGYCLENDSNTPFIIANDTPVHVHVNGLQIKSSGTSGTGDCVIIENQVGVVEMQNCYLYSDSTAYYSGGYRFNATVGDIYIWNNIINGGYHGVMSMISGANVKMYNCLITNFLDDAVESNDILIDLYNCVVFNNADDWKDSFVNVYNCASDDNDVGVGGVALEENANGEWDNSFTDYVNDDFRVLNGEFSVMHGAALNKSGVWQDLTGEWQVGKDIVGTLRNTWDIGPFEYLAE